VPIALADSTTARLAEMPIERLLADSGLRIVNVFKLEAAALLNPANVTNSQVIEQLVREVFTPYVDFWHGYVGDESAFRKWARTLCEADHIIHATLASLVATNVDSLFASVAAWLTSETRRSPRGTWFLVYGPGWTNMGGLGAVGMVADFTRQRVDKAALVATLAHELTHQVHSARPVDPDTGTVLERVVSEGLASYADFVHSRGTRSPARSVGYSDEEWTWSIANEPVAIAAARAILMSTERADLDRVASRRVALVPGGPTAAGYFLGFRIVDAYVARFGAASWHDLLSMPVREVLLGSGHDLGADSDGRPNKALLQPPQTR
jgi:hypothetical protein